MRGTSTKGKLTGISVLNAKETILKKINLINCSFILVNTASVLIL